jgi:hypothetical protein
MHGNFAGRKNREKTMNYQKTPRLSSGWLALILTTCLVQISCTNTGLKQSPRSSIIAPPQVIYRIDDHRHFIIENDGEEECYAGIIVYIDEKLGIKSTVESWERAKRGRRKFTIDASNDKYLGAPTEGSSGNCSSGSGNCLGNATKYSVDYGQTWLYRGQGSQDDILISGNKFYEYSLKKYKKINGGRSSGEYFYMSEPNKVAPYLWIGYQIPGTEWHHVDYGITLPIDESKRWEVSHLAEFEAMKAANPEKIPYPPTVLKKPLDNSFHCVKTPIIDNE